MTNKPRSPLQVSDKFLMKLKELQRLVRMKTGDEKSLRQLTEEITTTSAFEEFERKLMQGENINIGFNIKFDGRMKK